LQLVALPYNLLLQRNSREALGIDLSNHVVIIDEAHSKYNFPVQVLRLLTIGYRPD
jgi:Rad3-related DNA helicase